jgi:hypothetical protein
MVVVEKHGSNNSRVGSGYGHGHTCMVILGESICGEKTKMQAM